MARGEGFGLIVGQGVKYMQELFAEKGWGDLQFMRDFGMQVKGLEYSQYQSKESLAQQGGYALTNKGPQHDEAWLIFMDMVNNQIPTFEDKAEALHYFPLFRTWFGLMGLCKLPWNDIEPEDNAKHGKNAAKVPGARPQLQRAVRGHHGQGGHDRRLHPRCRRASTTSSACSTCAWAWAGARATGRRTARWAR